MTASCSSTTTTPFLGSVALPYWQTLVRVAEQVGVSPENIVALTSNTQNQEALSSVPVEPYIALFEAGLEQCSDFGLTVGKLITPGTYPVLGMTLLSCQNLLQVLEQVVRYESLNHDLGKSHLELGQHESVYKWTPNDWLFPNIKSNFCFHLIVSVFAGIRTFSPWLINSPIPFKQINFTGPEPANAKIYKDFFESDIRYNQTTNSIVVESKILDWPVLNGDTSSFSALTSYAETLLSARTQQQDIISKLNAILPEALRRQAFRIDDLASQLNMSSRTLQRKLKDSGNSYQSLLDDVRRGFAEHYLQATQLSMNEIAFLIGYQEQSSFNHAFKGWNGISPSSYREQKERK